MKKSYSCCFALLFVSFSLQAANQDGPYTVDTAMGDQELLINGIEYSAKDNCYDFQFGDQVVFLSGDPNGKCTDALLMNLRSNGTCDVWCQYPL